MENCVTYYLKDIHLTEAHKRHISQGMKAMYAAKGGMSPEHKANISKGMKRVWRYWKIYWGENPDGEAETR